MVGAGEGPPPSTTSRDPDREVGAEVEAGDAVGGFVATPGAAVGVGAGRGADDGGGVLIAGDGATEGGRVGPGVSRSAGEGVEQPHVTVKVVARSPQFHAITSGGVTADASLPSSS